MSRARIAILAGAMMAAAVPAAGDSGYASHPAPVIPQTEGRWMDEESMGTRFPSARSPTGRLYEIPLDPDGEADPRAEGWQRWSFVELGVLALEGDAHARGFRAYRDLHGGFHASRFAFAADRPAGAFFVEMTGVAAGRDDQSYRVRAGRYNDWRVAAFYDGTPYVHTTTYRSLWDGVGTGDLRLRGLAPGGGANAAATRENIVEALATTGESSLEVLRRKAGVRIDKHLTDSWKAFASLTEERRDGARPFGAVFGGGGGGGNVEVPESIEYATRDLAAGLQYSDPLSSFNLLAAASFFRNDVASMAFENPLHVSLNGSAGLAPRQFTHGRFALAPDNQHYNVKGEYARSLPSFFRGRFTAAVSLGWMRQDEDLLAPTDFDLAGGTVSAGGASLENAWNTPAALSRDSADARLDTRLVDLGLLLRPADGWDVRGKLRWFETRNGSQYLSCNPLTGQWGRLLNDGSGLALVGPHTMARVNPAGTQATGYDAGACDPDAVRALELVPSAGNLPIAAIPNDYRRLEASVAAAWRLGRASSLDGELAHESFDRDFRERAETRENRVKLSYVNRGAIDGTIRLGYEYARRGGSAYDPNVSNAFRGAALGPLPSTGNVAVPSWLRTFEQFRTFDLADRRQHGVTGRVDYAIHPNADLAFSLRHRDADFPGAYGRSRQRSSSGTLDLTVQAGPAAVLYGFYSLQDARMRQRGLQPNACVLNYTYYFYSDGRVLSTLTGAAPPATPAGATLLATREIDAANWAQACGTASPASPLFPESRAWDVDSRDRNHTLGFGLRYDFGKVRLDTSFSRALGRTRIGYAYDATALGVGDEEAALAGRGLPDIAFAHNVLDASVMVPINRVAAVRLMVRHERGRIRDWHHDGASELPMPTNNAVYLDGGPRDWRATVVGLFLQVRL